MTWMLSSETICIIGSVLYAASFIWKISDWREDAIGWQNVTSNSITKLLWRAREAQPKTRVKTVGIRNCLLVPSETNIPTHKTAISVVQNHNSYQALLDSIEYLTVSALVLSGIYSCHIFLELLSCHHDNSDTTLSSVDHGYEKKRKIFSENNSIVWKLLAGFRETISLTYWQLCSLFFL